MVEITLLLLNESWVGDPFICILHQVEFCRVSCCNVYEREVLDEVKKNAGFLEKFDLCFGLKSSYDEDGHEDEHDHVCERKWQRCRLQCH